MTPQEFAVSLVTLVIAIYVLFFVCKPRSHDPEYFDEPPPPAPGKTQPAPPAPEVEIVEEEEEAPEVEEEKVKYDLKAAILFSDATVTNEQRAEFHQLQDNSRKIKSVDQRFQEAKRKIEEHGMRPGILPNKKRRQLVEALIRRPFCGRRTRSWRTEFSDSMRGDVVPKSKNNDLGMMRMGRSDPKIDLHPGALGQMSGLSGRWISTENLPDNMFDDMEETVLVPLS